MNYKLVVLFLIASFVKLSAFGQSETYSIKKASFSSDKYDEFAPVYYKNGIVFCTNRNPGLMFYSTSQSKGLFKIYYIDTIGEVKWQNAKLFSKNLTTKLNDGPVAFNSSRDTIYYSRNLQVGNNFSVISSPRNEMGIFNASLIGNTWGKIRELRINNEWYNITTPWLSPDGRRLYFASDKSGGFGGSDLYYSQWKDDYWNDPVNLGPVINTKGNEVYPFLNPAGELFFASDGHPGFGKKDIFFSRFSEGEWLDPVHLDAPVNSPDEDFGIITDSLMNEGFFSSDRDKSFDIFHFKTNIAQSFYRSIQKENQYCFMFSDSGSIKTDTLKLKYIWDFGDGKIGSGTSVNHCFTGSGKYYIKLNIVDRKTGDLFFPKLSYYLELRDFEQPYINSYDIVVRGDSVDFDGLKSFLPGNRILYYSWDFGDGSRSQGERVKHSFTEKGEYLVNLGLTIKNDLTGKIRKTGTSKKILVLNDLLEKSSYLTNTASSRMNDPKIEKYSNAYISQLYSAEKELKQDAVFQVEILTSMTRINIQSDVFNKVPKKYAIEEIYNSEKGVYSYVTDQQMSLMDTYNAYKEISGSGYEDACTKIFILKDPAAKELNILKKIFGTSTDSYFDRYNRLTANAYLLLDQILKILNKYPEIKLEIAVHTDTSGLPEDMVSLSEKYARTITNYMIIKGIESKRLIAKGFGATRPLGPNLHEEDKKLNRRVDFRILRELSGGSSGNP
jgi:outer membrane protein OmpA-like peptidoglycan-associated protein